MTIHLFELAAHNLYSGLFGLMPNGIASDTNVSSHSFPALVHINNNFGPDPVPASGVFNDAAVVKAILKSVIVVRGRQNHVHGGQTCGSSHVH